MIFPMNLAKQTDELKRLIAEYPDYPIVVLAGEEANGGDYSWMFCSDIRFGIDEILDCEVPYAETVFCDRAVSHQIVRHRIASYSQESQRYCNYTKDGFGRSVTFISPVWVNEHPELYDVWKLACQNAEDAYFCLIDSGCTPQEARTVLPNCTKTEIVCTMNVRELRHFLKLRTSNAADPSIREVSYMLLDELKQKVPVLFGDIGVDNAER